MLEVFTGDDWDIAVTLKKDGSPFDVSTATAIEAAIVSTDDRGVEVLVPAVTLDSGATGADWANGVVVVEIPSASTGSLSSGAAYIEIQVTMGGKKSTWPRNKLTVKKGTIA
jgi:hypothetical protein